jgi:hypothetical protein
VQPVVLEASWTVSFSFVCTYVHLMRALVLIAVFVSLIWLSESASPLLAGGTKPVCKHEGCTKSPQGVGGFCRDHGECHINFFGPVLQSVTLYSNCDNFFIIEILILTIYASKS